MPAERMTSAPGDPVAWREFCEIMGRDDAIDRLRTFRTTLARQKTPPEAGIGDIGAETRVVAHRLVGQAGLLGFPALAEAAAALDACLKAGRTPEAVLAHWRAELSEALAGIDAYLGTSAAGGAAS